MTDFSLSRPGLNERVIPAFTHHSLSAAKRKQNQKLVCINILKLVKQMGKQIQTSTIIDESESEFHIKVTGNALFF